MIKKCHICSFLLTLGIIATVSASHAAGQLRFERLASTLGHNQLGPIVDIVQDRVGFIWIAGQSGIGRFDGHAFKFYRNEYSNPNSLANDYVHDLHIDKSGQLWAGTDNGLSRYDTTYDNFINYHAKQPLSPNEEHANIQKSKHLNNSIIYAISHNTKNQLALATHYGVSIFDQDKQHFTNYVPQDKKVHSKTQNTVHAIFVDSQDTVWVGTQNLGLAKLNLSNGQFTFFQHDNQNPNSLIFDGVRGLFEDSKRRLWIATYGGGVSRLDLASYTFDNYQHSPQNSRSLGSNTVWKILEDSNNQIWLASDQGGLARYREKTNDFEHFRHAPGDKTTLPTNVVRSILEDSQGDLWVGTFPSGLSYHNRTAAIFKNYRHDPDDPNSISNNAILSFLKDKNNTLWVGTEGGLNAKASGTKVFKRYLAESPHHPQLKSNAILALGQDNKDQVWVGTWSGGLHTFDIKNQTFQNFQSLKPPQSPNSLFIWHIYGEKDNMWLGTETGGLNFYDSSTGGFEYFRHDSSNPNSLSSDFVSAVTRDNNGVIWVGSLSGLDSYNEKTQQFTKHYLKKNSGMTSDQNVRVRSLMLDTQNRLWVGTSDDGVYIYTPKLGKAKHLSTGDGLPAKHVATIVEDNQGDVWLGTIDGLARVSPRNWKVRIFRKGDGLVGNTINRNASFKDDDGKIYIGTTNGFSVFDPARLKLNHSDFPVKLVNFKLFNKIVSPSKNSLTLKQNIIKNPPITLHHSDNMFSFEFAALSFKSPQNNRYKYKLKGFDQQWHEANSTRSATYTNIDPGHYTFRVQAANNDGVWSKQSVSQDLIILPPAWRTWWAYILYIFSACIITLTLLRIKTRSLEYENQKALNAELQRINKVKDSFLANTSHELRTPLSGMVGIAEALESDPLIINSQVKEQVSLIKVSGQRLANLINDILDYSKISDHKLELFISTIDVKTLVEDIIMLLNPLAKPKGLKLINNIQDGTPKVSADANRIQQILINIIGNAIKYSHQGNITISASVASERLEIAVADEGQGIRREQLSTIFDDFTQADAQQSMGQASTGLGLSIAKKLVELHGGEIYVESTINIGSKFTIALPIAAASSEAAEPTPTQIQQIPPKEPQEHLRTPSSNADLKLLKGKYKSAQLKDSQDKYDLKKSKPLNATAFTILIVDDDPVNRLVINKMLKIHDYKVEEAINGKTALERIEAANKGLGGPIDLVIMDIVMPIMNGLDACKKIRIERNSFELPIIFLSAKHQDSEIAAAFSAGGNEILTKPVSKYELLPRVAEYINILASN